MKKSTLTLSLILLTGSVFAGDDIKEVSVAPKVNQVTVFLNGAELHQSSKVELVQGKNMVKFTGLSSKLDANSIVVDIEEKNATILSVYSSNNFLADPISNPKTKPLKDSIESLNDQLAYVNGAIETYTNEKTMLNRDGAILGKDKGSNVDEIKKSVDFFDQKCSEINVMLNASYKSQKKLTARLNLLYKQLSELNAVINPPSSEVTVLVLAGQAGTFNFGLKYRVRDAGWEPKYDIRVDAITKPVNLFYRANIFNNTGVDWVDVKMKLSTADPQQGAQYPKLKQWKLNEDDSSKLEATYQETQNEELKTENNNINFKTIEVDELSAEFDIEQPYTIPADSKPYLVDVTNKSLDATYEYVSVPKMDKDAFLVAKVVGWSDLNLVSGDASIYFNGTYIGQSRINILEISDTLELSLGRDSKIAISRLMKSEVNDHHIIGNNEKEVYKYETVVKNNHEAPVTIKIQDQVPVENDSRINVSISEVSGGIYNTSSGEVTWKMTLQPGEIKKLVFDFTVKSPKEFRPHMRTFRTISCPSF
jgi:uncharacterized protein (TIGR02231 family)